MNRVVKRSKVARYVESDSPVLGGRFSEFVEFSSNAQDQTSILNVSAERSNDMKRAREHSR